METVCQSWEPREDGILCLTCKHNIFVFALLFVLRLFTFCVSKGFFEATVISEVRSLSNFLDFGLLLLASLDIHFEKHLLQNCVGFLSRSRRVHFRNNVGKCVVPELDWQRPEKPLKPCFG